jgi:hypothetical protein
MWNARHPDVLIKATSPKDIWQGLNRHLASVCSRESCWLKQGFVNGRLDQVLKQAYAPESPKSWLKNPHEWLSSVDISKVMKLQEQKYRCFDFMGPSPIDYSTRMHGGECVWEELCKFNLAEQIKRGKTKIGVIFNTDPHYKDGSHWISLFINIKKGIIYFYDSVGTAAPKEVKEFADSVIEQGKNLSPPIAFTYDENKGVTHQRGNTECGMYSLFFIIHMLQDKIDIPYLKKNRIDDNYVHKFRKVFFNQTLAGGGV